MGDSCDWDLLKGLPGERPKADQDIAAWPIALCIMVFRAWSFKPQKFWRDRCRSCCAVLG